MTLTLAEQVTAVTRTALASGALVPFEISGTAVDDAALPWRIEWASSLARKDQAAIPKPGAKPGAFNPFLPYDPALYISDLGPGHVLLLNKFPVLFNHVLVVTRAFADQQHELSAADFTALASAMSQIDGLAFFNGGVDAGASVQHRHLQIAPFASPLITALLPQAAADGQVQQLAALPFRHAFTRFAAPWPADVAAAGTRLHEAYRSSLAACGLSADADGTLPAYNLLATREWLLLVPRRRETWEDRSDRISLNAMSFAGSIFVRDPALMPKVLSTGLLPLLGAVTFPR